MSKGYKIFLRCLAMLFLCFAIKIIAPSLSIVQNLMAYILIVMAIDLRFAAR